MNRAIQRASQPDVALQSAMFTASLDTAMHASRHLNGSAALVNDHTAFRIDGMPLAWLRHFDLSPDSIGHTIRNLQIDKMLVVRLSAL